MTAKTTLRFITAASLLAFGLAFGAAPAAAEAKLPSKIEKIEPELTAPPAWF